MIGQLKWSTWGPRIACCDARRDEDESAVGFLLPIWVIFSVHGWYSHTQLLCTHHTKTPKLRHTYSCLYTWTPWNSQQQLVPPLMGKWKLKRVNMLPLHILACKHHQHLVGTIANVTLDPKEINSHAAHTWHMISFTIADLCIFFPTFFIHN